MEKYVLTNPVQHQLETEYYVQQIGNIISRVRNEFYDKLKTDIIKKLNQLNYYFNNDDDFLEFVKNRITRIESAKNLYYFYLDYNNIDHTGTILTSYKESVEIEFKDEKFTGTIFTQF
jgi:hypothetical protein